MVLSPNASARDRSISSSFPRPKSANGPFTCMKRVFFTSAPFFFKRFTARTAFLIENADVKKRATGLSFKGAF